MSAARSYQLERGPLSFADVLAVAADAVTAALAESPDRAALAFEAAMAWLVPGHARPLVDQGRWQPKTADEWMRLAAYSGGVDAWQGSQWRASRGQPADQIEAFAAAYTVAWGAVHNAINRAKNGVPA